MLLEKIIKQQLVSFLDETDALSDNRSGPSFRRDHSTNDLLAIAKAVTDWFRNLDQDLTTVIAFIDLAKVQHEVILLPLQQTVYWLYRNEMVRNAAKA